MSSAQDEISELMALQREAAPRQKRRKPRKSDHETNGAGEAAAPAADDPDPTPASDISDESEASELEEAINEFTDNLEAAVQEIGDSAQEQPALTALVAFTLGIVVGQLFSRR